MAGGIERLKGVVVNELGMDPMNGDVFIFVAKSRRMIKLLHYENNVFTLYTRKIYRGSFIYPKIDPEEDKYKLNWRTLSRLVKGYINSN